MIIRNVTAIIAAIFLVTVSEAKANRIDNFCGDRYCGQVETPAKSIKKTVHKEKIKRAVRVASLGNEAIGTAPSGLAAQAKSYVGQTASDLGVRRSLWCSAFIRKITNAVGVDDRAISWLSKPRIGPVINAIAVMRHHVGIVTGFTNNGDPILISGNHGHKVGIAVYPKHRILAYVAP